MDAQILLIFGARLPLHQRHVVLEGHGLAMQPFDRDRLDDSFWLPDVEALLGGIDPAADPLAGQASVTVGEEITLPTSVSEPCMKVSLHTAPLCMVI